MTTYVLVHGAWHGGWCWRRVAELLQARGHTVYAPTLSGVGERSHLASERITLTTHVMDVVNEVLWKDLSDIVLCGHSYGGMVITQAIEQISGRIASVVYVDAFLPEDGQCLDDLSGAQRPPEPHLVAPISAEAFNVNMADRAWVDAKVTPQSSLCFRERVRLSGALGKISKKTYILAGSFSLPPFDSAYAKLAQDPGWDTHVILGGHDLMLDNFQELADILIKAAPVSSS
jgi:pimeloyl-ACP methyl ester carboxylesterase